MEQPVKVVTKTDEYTIFQRRDNRYAVKDVARQWVNGAAKVAILLEHKLIEAAPAPAPEPEAAADADAGAQEAAEGGDASPGAEAEAGSDEDEADSEQ